MFSKIHNRAIRLRKQGKTYTEIIKELKFHIPKSTLSYWFKHIDESSKSKKLREQKRLIHLQYAREKSLQWRTEQRKKYLDNLRFENRGLKKQIANQQTAKIALTILYLGEGSKSPKRGSLVFGNSDPAVIKLFLQLLRKIYEIQEEKFRCTVQCRADQNIKSLEQFWSKTTNISHSQFYASRVDPRTVGVQSRKLNYKVAV